MKNQFKILYLLFFPAFFSCKSDDFNASVVLAGKYNSTYLYHEINPPLQIETELDSNSGFYLGTDSIDLNLDGNFDLIINLKTHPNDTIYKVGGIYSFPYCRLILKNGYELAIRNIGYSCHAGLCVEEPFIDALEFNTEISQYPKWSESVTKQTLWNIIPGNMEFPRGWWYYAENKEMYIGVRIKERALKKSVYYKYGWIKVNALSLKNVSFISYAME